MFSAMLRGWGVLVWCCVNCSQEFWVEVGVKIANFQKFEENAGEAC
jgi:polyferredoxin